MELSHVDEEGNAAMVDISGKRAMYREARASGSVHMSPETISHIRNNQIKKGDVLSVARIAAIGGAKKTSELIPLCHNIPINKVGVDFTIQPDRIDIRALASCEFKTGIEMEALTAVSIAALTIYDMCKAVDRSMVISDIKLERKIKNEIQS